MYIYIYIYIYIIIADFIMFTFQGQFILYVFNVDKMWLLLFC